MPENNIHLPQEASLPKRLLLGFVLPVFVLLLLLFGFLAWFSLPVFFSGENEVFSLRWRPEQGHYGILPMILGSGMLAVLALLISFPIAVGISGFCLLHPRHWTAKSLKGLIRLMAGIPTVVYGITALMVLVPLLRNFFQYGSGFCLLATALVLCLLILPVMVMVLENQLQENIRQYELTATALGMSRAEMIIFVVLPQSGRGLATASLLGFSRAIGDTMLPLMLAGNAPQLPGSLLDSIRSLTAHIGLVIATEHGSAAYNSLFSAGLILLGISVMVTLTTRWLEHRHLHRHSNTRLRGGDPS